MLFHKDAEKNITYKEVVVPSSAITYLINHHLFYGLTLAKKLAVNPTLYEGVVTTFLPPVNIDKLDLLNNYEFSIQQFFSERISIDVVKKEWLLPMILSHLKQNDSQRYLCVIEEHDEKRGSPNLATAPNKIILYGDEIYHVVFDQLASMENLSISFDWSTSWFFTVVLTSLDNSCSLEEISEFAISEIELLASRVEKIIISAYDKESYLVWHKSR